jgi:GGDEF domain-containing protein
MDASIDRVFDELDLDDAVRDLWEPVFPHLGRALDGDDVAFLDAVEQVARSAGLCQSVTVEDLLGSLSRGSRALRAGLLADGAAGAEESCRRIVGLEPVALTRIAAGYFVGMEETIIRLRREAAESSAIDAPTGAMRREHIFDRLTLEVERCQRMDLSLGLLELEFEEAGVGEPQDGGSGPAMVIPAVSECLRDNLRRYDSIGLAPDGGLLLVLPNISRRGLSGAAERLRRELDGCVGDHSAPQAIFALAHYDFVDVNATDMIAALDQGMRQAHAVHESLIWS